MPTQALSRFRKASRIAFRTCSSPGRPRTALRHRADGSPAGGLKTRTSSLAAFQLVAEANDLYLAGRYQDAIERLQRSLKEDDKYAEAWALLGKSYGRLATALLNGAGRSAAPGAERVPAGGRAQPQPK